MPRPKRAKVASTATRVAKTSKTADPAPRKQEVTKTRTTAAPEPLKAFSSDSDGLVVKATRPRRQMPRQLDHDQDVDVTMSGALPVQNTENVTVPSPKNRTPLSKAERRRASKPSAQSSSRTSRRSSALANITREQDAGQDTPSIAQEEHSSGFGDNLLSFTSLDSESPAHGTRPPSAIKVGATPAHETSILALTNFKRRPRQHSLLRMVHQTTDIEDNDVDSDDLEGFDDFHPDAESTPLHTSKKTLAGEGANDSGVNLSSSGSRGTKRKLSPVVQVARSSPPYDSGPDVEASRSPSPSLPEVIQSTEDAPEDHIQADPERWSETMAPPLSSSDYQVDEVENVRASPVNARQRRRGTSKKASRGMDSEGEETDRPRRGKGGRGTRHNRGLSTAKLQSMLPRRRTQMPQEGAEYNLDSEEDGSLDSDQDELSMPQRRVTTTTRKSVASKPPKKRGRATRKPSVQEKPAAKNTRTYGRRSSSDKENENADLYEDPGSAEEEGSTIEVAPVKPSANLEAIAKKFEEIDDFEMEFESVSYVESSSPWR